MMGLRFSIFSALCVALVSATVALLISGSWALAVGVAILGGCLWVFGASRGRSARAPLAWPASLAEWLWVSLWMERGLEPAVPLFTRGNLYLVSALTVMWWIGFAMMVLMVSVFGPRPRKRNRSIIATLLILAAAVGLISLLAAPIVPSGRLVPVWGEFIREVSMLASVVILFRLTPSTNRAAHLVALPYATGVGITMAILALSGGFDGSRFGIPAVLHPNTVGDMAGLAALLVLALWREVGRIWLQALLAILFLALLASLSKTAIIGMAVGLAAWWFLGTPGKRMRRTIVLLGALCVLAVAAGQTVSRYFTNYVESPSGAATLSGRTQLWAATLKISAQRPWLGYGYGLYPDVIATDAPQISWDVNRITHAHDAPLTVLLEQGVLGLFLFMAWEVYAVVLCVRAGARSRPDATFVFAVLMVVFLLLRSVTEGGLAYRGDTPFLLVATLILERLVQRHPAPDVR